MGSQVEQWSLLQSDMSSAARDSFDSASQWFLDIATHSTAHVGLSFIAVFVLHTALKNDAWRTRVAAVLLFIMVMKDFSFDFMHDPELPVFLDIPWDAACYLFPWLACRKMARDTGDRARKAATVTYHAWRGDDQ